MLIQPLQAAAAGRKGSPLRGKATGTGSKPSSRGGSYGNILDAQSATTTTAPSKQATQHGWVTVQSSSAMPKSVTVDPGSVIPGADGLPGIRVAAKQQGAAGGKVAGPVTHLAPNEVLNTKQKIM
jgi:hypothetical protein